MVNLDDRVKIEGDGLECKVINLGGSMRRRQLSSTRGNQIKLRHPCAQHNEFCKTSPKTENRTDKEVQGQRRN